MKTTQKPFLTTNFYAAAYLLAHDVILMNVVRDGSGRATFHFEASEALPTRIHEFTLGQKAMVHAPAFIASIKRLKSLLYDGIS